MKFFRVLVLTLLVIVVLVSGGIFIFIKTFDFSHLKSQISREISRSIGREVLIGRLHVSLSWQSGMLLIVNDVVVADSPEFSSQPMIEVQQVQLGMDVFAFLKTREIVISKVIVQKPVVRLVLSGSGALNFQAIQWSAFGQPQKGTGDSGSQQKLPEFVIQAVHFSDGKIEWRDLSADHPMALDLTDIGLEINDISLTELFTYQMVCRFLSHDQNIQIKGRGQVDALNLQARFDDIQMAMDLSTLETEELKKAVPQIQDLKFRNYPKGKLNTTISQMVVGKDGLLLLSLEGTLRDGEVSLTEIPAPISNISADYEISETDIRLNGFSLQIGEGVMSGKGRIADYLKTQKYDFETDFKDIPVEDIQPKLNEFFTLKGKLSGRFYMSASGARQSDFVSSLKGAGKADIADGVLLHTNVLTMIFNQIPMLGAFGGSFLQSAVDEKIPQQYKDVLTREHTVFDHFTIETNFEDALIKFKSDVGSEEFNLTGQGEMDWNQQIKLDSNLVLSEDFSSYIFEKAEELQALAEPGAGLKIPLVKYEGELSKLKLNPDLEYIGKRIIHQKGRDEIQNYINKVFRKDDSSQETPNPQDGTAPQDQTEEKKPPEQVIIESIFDSIFNEK